MNNDNDLNSEINYYKTKLFSTAYNLFEMEACVARDYVWRYYSILNEVGNSCKYAVPADFDPGQYLLLNPDIVYAGVNPYQHYAEVGVLEGRQFHIALSSVQFNNVHSDPDPDLEKNAFVQLENSGVKKKIIFHIGGPKTGSSALQNALELNYRQLEKFGYAYENRLTINSNYETTPGNGFLLYDLLRNNAVTDEQLDCVILSYLGANLNGICSSEILSMLNENEWSRILQSTRRLHLEYSIVFYIRNVVPFFYSAYNEEVKRHREYQSIYEFSRTFPWLHFIALDTLHNCIGINRVKVFLYDAIGVDIVKHFLGVIGIDDSTALGITVFANRSLTPVELAFVKVLNKCLFRHNKHISDSLIYLRPNNKSAVRYEEQVVSLLGKRFNNDIEWVNKTFFNSDVVELLPNHKLVSHPFVHFKEIQLQEYEECLFVMKELCKIIAELCRCDNIRRHMDLFNSSILKFVNRPDVYLGDLPDDFDPIEYLLLNPDIVFAGMNAFEHYISYGMSEGRDYKIFNKTFFNKGNHTYSKNGAKINLVFNDSIVLNPKGGISLVTPIASMIAIEQVELDVAITNDGNQSWIGGLFRAVNISYHWFDAEWNIVVYEGERTALPEGGVPGGQTILAKMKVVVPAHAGEYYLVLTLVQEFEGWFDNIGNGFNPAIIKIAVG